MEDFTEWPKRQPIVHDVFDDRRSTTLMEAVGVSPEAIGALHLLVYELGGWLPVRDKRLPTQRHPEQAKLVVGSLLLSLDHKVSIPVRLLAKIVSETFRRPGKRVLQIPRETL